MLTERLQQEGIEIAQHKAAKIQAPQNTEKNTSPKYLHLHAKVERETLKQMRFKRG